MARLSKTNRAALAVVAAQFLLGATLCAQSASPKRNLQVLSPEISEDDLLEVMLENLRGLGLPRRAGEGCLYCHEGNLETPRSQWNYAGDGNPKKHKARTMMAMVKEINERFLPALGHRLDAQLEVTCDTCHAGRTDPSPLPDLLLRRYGEGGLEALESTYREARGKYLDAGVYDLRVTTLIEVAGRLYSSGASQDALAVHRLNVDTSADPAARSGLVEFVMQREYQNNGAQAMFTAYRRLRREQPPEAFVPALLDSLGWQVLRGGDPSAGMQLFVLNFEEHPETFPAYESLAYALSMSGDTERGLALARAWLVKNPGHVRGLQLIDELSGKHDR